VSASLVYGHRRGVCAGCGRPQLGTGTLKISAVTPGAPVGCFDQVSPRPRSPPPENESLTPTASAERLLVYQILDSVRRLFPPRRYGRKATVAGPEVTGDYSAQTLLFDKPL
jgi:hypothetical protein